MTRPRTPRLLAAGTFGVMATALALAGCTDNAPSQSAAGSTSGGAGPLTVTSTDTACEVSAAQAGSGNLVFSVTNSGSKVTEFYLLGQDGLRIVGEVENIGPGLTRDLVVRAAPGSYYTACKPGMVGDGIRSGFTVTDSGADLDAGSDPQLVAQANTQYASYVKDQTEQLTTKTEAFAAAYIAGDARWDVIEALGFVQNPPVLELETSGFFAPVSAEQIGVLDADVAILFPIGFTLDELKADPLIASLKVVQENRAVYLASDDELTAAFSAASPLSIPIAVAGIVPQLAAIAG